MIIGARYGLISTKNSGNRALRVRDEADMQRDMAATPVPRIDEEDGYQPVNLGVHQGRDWSDERQEYLDDFNEGSDENQRRFGAFDHRNIRHLRNSPSDFEDDIVNSYMARTPAVSNEDSFTNDPALSPASMQTSPLETSPSVGTDQSSPPAQARSLSLARRSTGGKWSLGTAIGLGMPRRVGSSQSQNQLRRRTPGRISSQDRRDSTEDMVIDGPQDSSRSGHRPLDSPQSSAAGSMNASGRGWKWLNGSGLAHVFSARNSEARHEGDDTSRWGQSRVPSSNIWGDHPVHSVSVTQQYLHSHLEFCLKRTNITRRRRTKIDTKMPWTIPRHAIPDKGRYNSYSHMKMTRQQTIKMPAIALRFCLLRRKPRDLRI